MKKKIFVFSHAMEIGGAERALLALLNCIDYSEYDVDLFLMRHSGELMELIPKRVNLLPSDNKYSSLAIPIMNVVKNGDFDIALGRLKGKLNAEKFNKKMSYCNSEAMLEYSHKYTKKYMPIISNKEYDLAISFLTPHYFVTEKVNAKKKIAWIHTDYSYLNLDIVSELKMWSAYDHIISISKDVTKAFLTKFPSLDNKIVLIENISSKAFIESQADMLEISDEISAPDIKLLSIGRFCEAKNFDNIPEIAGIIKSKGVDFKWYIIGYGGDEQLIRSKIAEFNMEDTVIILGKKENPYPYIKACDIYVQPSRYEGKAVTVCEALLLNKPVVITDYPTARSQIKNGFDGIIVPLDNQGCANALAEIMTDKELLNKLVENMKNTNYSNESEIDKLYELIEA